jgi:hypothetical protein
VVESLQVMSDTLSNEDAEPEHTIKSLHAGSSSDQVQSMGGANFGGGITKRTVRFSIGGGRSLTLHSGVNISAGSSGSSGIGTSGRTSEFRRIRWLRVRCGCLEGLNMRIMRAERADLGYDDSAENQIRFIMREVHRCEHTMVVSISASALGFLQERHGH